MAITNFIPTVWSENLYKQLNKKYIAVSNCNREWEGDIKQCGDRVKICGFGAVSVFNYVKNSDMGTPSALSDVATELVIDQAKAFNFQIDDIDAAQAKPHLMDMAVRHAANALANVTDKYIYNMYDEVEEGQTIAADLETENIYDVILDAVAKINASAVCNDLVLEITPKVASYLLKAKVDLSSNNSETLESGCIGSFAGCKVFVTSNVQALTSGDVTNHYCYLRSKRAIAYAEQLSEIEAYRPERRFADAIKGLHLFGAKIVYPSEIIVLKCTTPAITK